MSTAAGTDSTGQGHDPPAGSYWSALLADEEERVARYGLGAGILLVAFGRELLHHLDDADRLLAEARILGLIDRHLGWTDRTAVVAPGRLGVVVVPSTAADLARRAALMHHGLRERGLDVEVAYAYRRDEGGLRAAAARADAALDTVLARRWASEWPVPVRTDEERRRY
ncbi:MAG: hypothetical protein D6683_18195 [Actinomyces sp.]|nr:MAG: hypothetical protein D6683_18195 [Actinomyces sp.]